MNNYIVRSYRDVIVITKIAITKYAIRRVYTDTQSLSDGHFEKVETVFFKMESPM